MKIDFYRNDSKYIAGMTMRDSCQPEHGNMALHACVSAGDVLKNRHKLSDILNIGIESWICLNQTHGDNFYEAKRIDRGRGAQDLETAVYDTDAVFTYEPNVLLCTFTADCIPVIFYNEDEGLIGLIHSGWQGTVKEITLKVFRYLMNSKGCSPKNMRVYIGKSICGEKFEVDEDVYLKFKSLNYAQQYIYYNEKTCKYHIDNKSIVKSQCELAGIPSTNIFIDPTCTYSDPDCFSYRRDKRCGRHMGFVLRNL